jgi:hypothetical protein
MGEAINVLSQPHDGRHVVLDHKQRQPAQVGLLEALDQFVDLFRVDTCGRLVQQEQVRVIDQRHGKRKQLLLAEGEIAGSASSFASRPTKSRSSAARFLASAVLSERASGTTQF